jgi:N-formylglutamate amidohydrolase
MALDEVDRLAEEDAATDQIIRDCPSTIRALDSRAEYDLNRPRDLALPLTPEMFWGTRVYASPPAADANRRSLEKYEAFYRFTASVIKVLLDRFGACVVYDFHSYNIQRQVDKGHPSPPVFNLGTRGNRSRTGGKNPSRRGWSASNTSNCPAMRPRSPKTTCSAAWGNSAAG